MPVHSEDGQAWSTKLKRIGELSASRTETVFNNLGHIIDVTMLREMFRRVDGNKAIGIDGVTKEKYGRELEENLSALLRRIRKGHYRPQPARIVSIPKEDGTSRPLAIACLEDKIVQAAVASILESVFEPVFLDCSFGFRPKRNAHLALQELMQQANRNQNGAIVEIDLRQCFKTIPHAGLKEFLSRKISDRRFLRLVHILMQARTVEDGVVERGKRGCPQGSIVSPILANIFLHYVIDDWFAQISRSHLRGRCGMVRYADDMVFTFQRRSEAERFFRVLPKRLCKYGLELHPDKSQLIPAGSRVAEEEACGDGRLPVFHFLGFTCYWGRSRSRNFWRLKFSSRADRFTAKLHALRDFLWSELHTNKTTVLLKRVIRVVRGWVNYHAISDNQRRVNGFIRKSQEHIYRWFQRRGDRSRMTFPKVLDLLRRLGFPFSFKTKSLFNPLKAGDQRIMLGSRMR